MSWSNWKMEDLIRRARAKAAETGCNHCILEFDDTLTTEKEKTMAYQEQVGRTMLFRNRDKKNDKHPDFKGKVEVLVTEPGIVTIDLALWERAGAKAGMYFGVSATAKDVRPNEDVNETFRE